MSISMPSFADWKESMLNTYAGWRELISSCARWRVSMSSGAGWRLSMSWVCLLAKDGTVGG